MIEYKRAKPLITIEGVSKTFNGKLILRDIGTPEKPFIIYDVERPGRIQGQTIAVVGESGSGKSTLFKLIAGIHQPTTGTITIPNEYKNDGTYKLAEAGDIGFVQQTYPLSRNQTVNKMLMLAARQGGIPKKERAKKVDSFIESWNLSEQRHLSKKPLSGGQRQRVAIIEQLLCSHHMLIFDEPFSGLDVRNIDDVKKSFEMITQTSELGTIIFSTHDIHLAVEMADLIYVVGFEKGIKGATIIRSFDLMEMGLAWESYGQGHVSLTKEIQSLIKLGTR
jgi:ABC-type nitrate/sulfonate/bicarbonate transport system ATPase subunit